MKLSKPPIPKEQRCFKVLGLRIADRTLAEAAAAGVGLALVHSHALGCGWQNMSPDDIAAEQGNAGAVFGANGTTISPLLCSAFPLRLKGYSYVLCTQGIRALS